MLASASPPGSLRRWQTQVFLATWFAYAGYYFCRKAFYAVKVQGGIGDNLHLSGIELAHLGTAYELAYAIGQFASGYAGTKLGAKRLLLIGMAATLACNLAFGLSNGFWTVFFFMVVNGLAQATGWPGCIGSLGPWFAREKRGTILGVWSTCYQLGSVAATALAAYLLGLAGWRYSFFGASAAISIAWTIVLLVHPNDPEHHGIEPAHDVPLPDTSSPGPTGNTASVRNIALAVALMGSVYFCIKFLRYALWSWTPFVLSNHLHVESANAGYLSTVFDLAGFLGVIVAGVLSDRLFRGRRSVVSTAMMVGMSLAFVGLYFVGTSSIAAFAVGLAFCGFLLYGPDSLLSGVGAIEVGSPRLGLAIAAIINGIGSLGPIAQEQIVGRMLTSTRTDITPVLLVFAVIATVGTGLMLTLHIFAKRGRANV